MRLRFRSPRLSPRSWSRRRARARQIVRPRRRRRGPEPDGDRSAGPRTTAAWRRVAGGCSDDANGEACVDGHKTRRRPLRGDALRRGGLRAARRAREPTRSPRSDRRRSTSVVRAARQSCTSSSARDAIAAEEATAASRRRGGAARRRVGRDVVRGQAPTPEPRLDLSGTLATGATWTSTSRSACRATPSSTSTGSRPRPRAQRLDAPDARRRSRARAPRRRAPRGEGEIAEDSWFRRRSWSMSAARRGRRRPLVAADDASRPTCADAELPTE